MSREVDLKVNLEGGGLLWGLCIEHVCAVNMLERAIDF